MEIHTKESRYIFRKFAIFTITKRHAHNITNIFRWHTDLYICYQLNRNTSCDCRKLLIYLSITQLFRTITLSKFNCEQAHHLGLHETRFSTTSSKRGSKEMNEHPPLPTCTILKCFENISFFLLFTDKWTWPYRLGIRNFVLLAKTKYLHDTFKMPLRWFHITSPWS